MSIPVDLLRLVFVVLSCGLLLLACSNSQFGNDSEISISSVPPFSTREPESYQALRAITLGGLTSADSSRTTSIRIARQGQRRRQEYEVSGRRLVYLEIPAGRFILSPEDKLYAELKTGSAALPAPDVSIPGPAISSFSQPRSESRYQRLGREVLAGRATIKYRVTASESDGSSPSETLIWVDELLGIPVRSEMRRGTDKSLEVLIELTDIKLDVDESLFELPGDYKQVEAEVMLDRLRLPANHSDHSRGGSEPTSPRRLASERAG